MSIFLDPPLILCTWEEWIILYFCTQYNKHRNTYENILLNQDLNRNPCINSQVPRIYLERYPWSVNLKLPHLLLDKWSTMSTTMKYMQLIRILSLITSWGYTEFLFMRNSLDIYLTLELSDFVYHLGKLYIVWQLLNIM